MSFNLPGIGDYLNKEFQVRFGKDYPFKRINEVLFINLDFLIEYLDVLQCGSTMLERSIDKVYSLMRKRKRQSEIKKSIEYLNVYHEKFDQYFHSTNIVDEKRKSYVEFVFKELGIEDSF